MRGENLDLCDVWEDCTVLEQWFSSDCHAFREASKCVNQPLSQRHNYPMFARRP